MRYIIAKISLLLLVFISVSFVLHTTNKKQIHQDPPFWQIESKWVDSVFNSLSPNERIAQLFMVAAYSNKDNKHVREIRELIEKYNIGGLIFMQGGPVREAKLTNYYQTRAKTPLMISIDGEWGLAMRLDSTPQYPKQMTLGAILNDSLIYLMGKQIASECKLMGIHVNFAPDIDINNNPNNPVISMRSFGENKFAVARKAEMYMNGMQDYGVMATCKHFPGHGDTDSDSHKTLPTIKHPWERLDSLELYPFRELFSKNVASVMVAHLYIPSLDTTKNQASTLSKYIVSDLLKQQMQFKGLVFTDALNMKGASKYNAPGVVDAKALVAGNDVLLFSENVPVAIEEIKKAIAKGEITQDEVDARCKKILKAKYWCGLNKKQFVREKTIYKNLNTDASDSLNQALANASVTLLQNNGNIIPLKKDETQKIAIVSVGNYEKDQFNKYMNNFAKADFFGLTHKALKKERDTILKKLKNYDVIILEVNKTNNRSYDNFGVSNESIAFIDSVANIKPTISIFFSNPYLLSKFKNLNQHAAIFELYEYNRFSQKAAADAISGALTINGKLPVSTGIFKINTGIEMNKTQESFCAYPVKPKPKQLLINKLQQIDSIVLAGINDGAFPGCQVLALKDGNTIYNKSFGRFTYDKYDTRVSDSSVYDLASLTKIMASSLVIMKLVDEGKLSLDSTLVYYLPELKGSNKADIKIREMISHQAGLQAWLPFYQRTLNKKNEYKHGYYETKKSKEFPTRVAENLYIKKHYTDSIYKRITESSLEKKGEYLYSDLGYYYILKIAEKITGKPYDQYLHETFYKPLGINLHYNAREYFNFKNIVPTENDTKFRKQLIRGDVHDQGASMMGGIAGHAGLFGTAKDVAVVMQLLLNKGKYNGVSYISEEVVEEFTRKCAFCPKNRRGLCFDKPEQNADKDSPVTKDCSAESFGHSGFTGTFTWADPANGLIVVILSNRVYPDAENKKLTKSGIRSKIHKLLYEAIENGEVNN